MSRSRIVSIILTVLTLTSILPDTLQLECYVCQNQPDNKNKCVETVKTCDLSQDRCLSEVMWGSAANWDLTNQKQHFISKRCANKQECQEPNDKCDMIGYKDWNCTSCCAGDKCNYYVTLAGHLARPNMPVILVSVASSLAMYFASNQLVRE